MIELATSPEGEARFRNRFEPDGKKAVIRCGDGMKIDILKFYPNMNCDEWSVIENDEDEVICFMDALEIKVPWFDVFKFPEIHPDIPPCRHISVWRRVIAYFGFSEGLAKPVRVALIADSEGNVWHACRWTRSGWVSKMGPGPRIVHARLAQILGGIYGDRAHLFSSL